MERPSDVACEACIEHPVVWQTRSEFDGGLYDENTFYDLLYQGGVLRSAAFADNFNDGSRNALFWDEIPTSWNIHTGSFISAPAGGSLHERNGRLEVTIKDGSVGISYGYQARFQITGDADVYFSMSFASGGPAVGRHTGAGLLFYEGTNANSSLGYVLAGFQNDQGPSTSGTEWAFGVARGVQVTYCRTCNRTFGARDSSSFNLPGPIERPVRVKAAIRGTVRGAPPSPVWDIRLTRWTDTNGWIDERAFSMPRTEPLNLRLLGVKEGHTPTHTIAFDDFKIVGQINMPSQIGVWQDKYTHPTQAVKWLFDNCDCSGELLEYSIDGVNFVSDIQSLNISQQIWVKAVLKDSSAYIKRLELRYIEPPVSGEEVLHEEGKGKKRGEPKEKSPFFPF